MYAMKPLSRREVLELAAGSAGLLALGACEETDRAAEPLDTAEEPSVCGVPTKDAAEGPYYRPDAPDREDMRTLGEAGTELVFEGTVRSDLDCSPLAGAVVELWHAKQTGVYDMDTTDMHYRTRVRVGFDGTFRVTTLIPPSYPVGDKMMPRHLHFRINAPNHHELVTQLRWSGDVMTDGPFDPDLQMTPTIAADGSESVTWEFVLSHV
jgi:protocatechuate 3,4-dioxygenase beta subunit